jgi:hypothetical protein
LGGDAAAGKAGKAGKQSVLSKEQILAFATSGKD